MGIEFAPAPILEEWGGFKKRNIGKELGENCNVSPKGKSMKKKEGSDRCFKFNREGRWG